MSIQQMDIPQVTAAGVQSEEKTLPSFIYFPLKEELSAKTTTLDWKEDEPFCIGVYARERGSEVPTRLISSAKSWLCHPGIDRREKLLPLDSEELKLSPLQSCAELLKYLKKAWSFKHPEFPLEEQDVLITVPASFDPSARQFVQEAAQIAGFGEIVLLEEPQAAFYSWLHKHTNEWRKILKTGDHILVVDIGGGTTDFTLISVENEQGNLSLKRVAVGAHLLLGGDNMDLAVAYLARDKIEQKGHVLDDHQFQSLIHSSRKAKETLLSANAPKSVDLIIQGKGSRLIGSSIKVNLTQKEVLSLLVDGFIPLVSPKERSSFEHRLGIQEIGLPYAQDARISCQLAKFLSMTGEGESQSLDHFILPTAVLFNGGTLKADALQDRIVELLNSWAQELGKPSIQVLEKPDYDFAVSQGAAYYGLARKGRAIRIRGGTSRSYFIGVEDARPAVPGIPTPIKAVCVVPFGMEEGTEQELSSQEFALLLGERAKFRFFSRSTPKLSDGEEPMIGTVVRNWKQELTELHSLDAFLDKNETDGRTVRVKLISKVTELGVLELWCVSSDERKWKLEFDIRQDQTAQLNV